MKRLLVVVFPYYSTAGEKNQAGGEKDRRGDDQCGVKREKTTKNFNENEQNLLTTT
ncbi:MAG: hypothetical protein IK132_10580 [Clostridia bacterium]|nr:hypothetical protein [Clostridia bacterium]